MQMRDNEMMNRKRLRDDILSALSRVYDEDRDLLSDNVDACERSLMHRFTRYMMELVESSNDSIYKGYNSLFSKNSTIKKIKSYVDSSNEKIDMKKTIINDSIKKRKIIKNKEICLKLRKRISFIDS